MCLACKKEGHLVRDYDRHHNVHDKNVILINYVEEDALWMIIEDEVGSDDDNDYFIQEILGFEEGINRLQEIDDVE